MIKISQREVLEFLEKHKREWFTSRQISEKIRIGNDSCTNNITKLVRHKLIKRRETKGRYYCFEYSYKDKMKSKKVIFKTLKKILSFYDSYRISCKMSKEEAINKTLETYDDFYEWLTENKGG